jgi:hypothetical protein
VISLIYLSKATCRLPGITRLKQASQTAKLKLQILLSSFSFSRDIQLVTISRQAIDLISPTEKNFHKKKKIQKCVEKRKR